MMQFQKLVLILTYLWDDYSKELYLRGAALLGDDEATKPLKIIFP